MHTFHVQVGRFSSYTSFMVDNFIQIKKNENIKYMNWVFFWADAEENEFKIWPGGLANGRFVVFALRICHSFHLV